MEHCGIVGIVTGMQGTVLYAAGPGVCAPFTLSLEASDAPITLMAPWRVTLPRSYFGPGALSDV